MNKITYNKLVRDLIPEIIKADGHVPKLRILEANEYLLELKRKVVEEARELQQAETTSDIINELSDLQELIETILVAYSISVIDVANKQLEKRKKRGGFVEKLYLEYVEEINP